MARREAKTVGVEKKEDSGAENNAKIVGAMELTYYLRHKKRIMIFKYKEMINNAKIVR